MPTAGPLIANVSDTALWVATYRAMESERADALFQDPFARRLAGERGEAIVRAMPHGRRLAWPMVVRTVLLDELVTRLVSEQRADAVLNLAAGLDARPWRMALPASLHWYDVDLPGILEYKRSVLGSEPAKCVHESRPVDLTEPGARRALFSEIGSRHERVLVIAEGLLIYLSDAEVTALAGDLAAQRSFRWWLIDLASPRLLEFTGKQWSKMLRQGSARMRFAPAEGTAFFAPLGWREAEFRSIWQESIRLKRTMPLAWLWQLFSRFGSEKRREDARRFSGVVMLERANGREARASSAPA
jgi:methyltransferase (TIGR00027 family)